jgi:4-diphosphocytidyl-2-C-methyl-D-erythritol kinase
VERPLRELAPAKINLCLLVGPIREDGRHELVSAMTPIALFDELTIHDADEDDVHCPGVEGPNLALTALTAFRQATGWQGPGQRIEVRKRIPVAAGLGGGSSDAAAALRLIARRSGLGDRELLLEIAARLGSDVPALVAPRRLLVRGGGEQLEPLPSEPSFGVLVAPSSARLATAAVYAEADRLRSPRGAAELAELDPLDCIGENDLQAAACSLEPTIAATIAAVASARATHALVCGSGPTVIGLFAPGRAASVAAAKLRARDIDAVAVAAHSGRPVTRLSDNPAHS